MSKNTWELFIPAPVCEAESINLYNIREIYDLIASASDALAVSSLHQNLSSKSSFRFCYKFDYKFDYKTCAMACLPLFVNTVLGELEDTLNLSFGLTSLLRASPSSNEIPECSLKYSETCDIYAQIQVSAGELEAICQYGETNYLKELYSYWVEVSMNSSGCANPSLYEPFRTAFFNRASGDYDFVCFSAVKIIQLILEEQLSSNWKRDIYKQLELSDFLIKVEDYDLL